MKWKVVGAVVVLASLWLSSLPLVRAHGTLDQFNDPSQYSSWGAHSLLFYSPMGQEFTPTRPLLKSVELLLENFHQTTEPETISINVREGSLEGSVMGSSSAFVEPEWGSGWKSWIHFDFGGRAGQGITVKPGRVYVIEIVVPTLNWGFCNNDGDTYPGGRMIFMGTPKVNLDSGFGTFSNP